MSRYREACCAGIGLAALCSGAWAATQEEALADMTKAGIVLCAVFVVAVAVGVIFMKSRDKHRDPLSRLFVTGEAIHSVAPGTLITDCVRIMTVERIGALVILDGGTLKGIFTERDALNKVLAVGLDPSHTPVSEVMTRDPYCVSPTMTIGEALEVITHRRFRHLPVVENGKLLAIVSSGDLSRWLVKDQMGEVRELVSIAART